MKILPLLTSIFLANFLSVSFAFTCSDLSENQCNQLQKEGCIWSGTLCNGSYSPSCVPPNCYYIDSNYKGTVAPDGSPGKPLKTLSDGFTKISGKNGFLIIINILEDAMVGVTKSSTISSNITIKPLFEDKLCTIDFTQFTDFFGTALTIKSSLRIIRAKLELNYPTFIGGVLIFNVNSGGLYLENVEVHNASRTDYVVSLVRATNSIFSMVNCKFTTTIAYFQSQSGGMVIWKNVSASGTNILRTQLISGIKLTLEDCFFTGALGGTFLTASTGGGVLLKNCTFKDLVAFPIFIINSDIRMTMEDCIFDKIFSTSPRMFTFQISQTFYGIPYGLPSVIKNTSFTNIAVQLSILLLQGRSVSLSLLNVTMKNITQQQLNLSGLVSSGDLFNYPKGICCCSVKSAQLFVESSNFSEIGSHCFGLRDTIFTMKSSRFNNSQLSSVQEDSILKEDISNLDDDSGVSFITIQRTPYYDREMYQIFIENSQFIKNGVLPKSGGAIRFTGIFFGQITITGSEFIGNKAYYGGAIYSENALVTTIQLENNLFVDNSAYYGGVIYKIDKRSLEPLTGASVSITNNQFIGNKAVQNGGALYLYWDAIWISDTEFISNSAINGGALYYINLDEENNEEYGKMKNVSFIQNSASNVGGAMKLFFKYSQLKTEGVVLENNFDSHQQAIHQGRPSYYLLSFYDIKIMGQIARSDNLEDLVKNNELTKLSFTANTSESSEAEIKFKSGNELSQILRVQVFDSENNMADYIDDGEIVCEIVGYENNVSNYSASLVSSPVKFKFSNGMRVLYLLSEDSQGQFFAKNAIKMHGEPKTTATLQFSIIDGSSDFLQDSGMKGSFDLKVHFIDCEEGDIFESSTRSCSTCISGSYSFENPYKASHCNQCPSQIDCFGGNQVGPKSGYWMGYPKSLMAIKCPYPSACMGGYVDYEYFSNGKCLYPHQGNLCNQCAPQFAKFGSSTKCEDCKNTVEYYLRFCLFLLFQVAGILGLFKLNEKQDENTTFYVNILEIFINLIQINSIIVGYDLEWSSLSKEFLQRVNSLIPVNHDGSSIYCLISLVLPDNQNLIFVKLIVTSFQPFIIWGLSILAYFLILLCSQSQRKDIEKKLKEALGRLFIISAFLVQPNIILTCLEFFSCQNLSSPDDPKYYLTSDSEVKCWTSSHSIWSFGFALPLLLIWAVLLPAVLLFKTRKYSKLSCCKPFFYQGLDKKRFYWEFLMLFVKTFVIVLFTILSFLQTEIQVLGTFFVCLSLTVLFLKIRPYTDPRLHGLGFFSLATLALASYVGFFSSADNWIDTQMTVCSVLIVVANCGLFSLPAFYIIRDYTKSKRPESLTTNQAIAEAQAQIEPEKLSGAEEEQPKREGEKVIFKNEDDVPEVCNELNQETEMRKIYHAKKESIDNFSILQSSGGNLFSPLQTSRMSSTGLLLSPLATSQTVPKEFKFSHTAKESSVIQGDFMQKTLKQKKIKLTRINMKHLVVEEFEQKSIDIEKTETEAAMTETTSGRTQRETEEENLLPGLKLNKLNTKNSEETSSNL